MKHIVTLLLILNLSISAGQNYQDSIPSSYGYQVELGQIVPDFTLETPDGEKITMRSLRGKVVMLQFTASWCPVCRKEMPHIEQDIWQRHKNNRNFALYGIDLQEKPEIVSEFHEQMGITYPLALDVDGNIFYTFAQQNAGVTRNIIIDRDGKIVFMTRLFKQEEFDKMVKVIDTLIEQ